MCYDQEKTQGTDPRVPFEVQENLRAERDSRLRQNGCEAGNAQIGYAPRPSDADIVAELFRYQQPTHITLPKFAAINQAGKNFAEVILQNCPPGMDRTVAINYIRLARMLANAAVALNGLSL